MCRCTETQRLLLCLCPATDLRAQGLNQTWATEHARHLSDKGDSPEFGPMCQVWSSARYLLCTNPCQENHIYKQSVYLGLLPCAHLLRPWKTCGICGVKTAWNITNEVKVLQELERRVLVWNWYQSGGVRRMRHTRGQAFLNKCEKGFLNTVFEIFSRITRPRSLLATIQKLFHKHCC